MSAVARRRTRLLNLMRRHNLGNRELSIIINRTENYISALKRGVYPVSVNLLRLIELELDARP